jgi:uracil-DNA glycosylase family 4
LTLTDLYITSVGRCAPPDNKPTREELANCSHFLDREMTVLKRLRVVLVLGKIAFDGYLGHLVRRGVLSSRSGYRFGHSAEYTMPHGITLLCSYHPSMQNTLTGKLTREMFLQVVKKAKQLAGD